MVLMVQLGNSIVLWLRAYVLSRPIWCNAVREQCWWGLSVLLCFDFALLSSLHRMISIKNV